MHTGFATTMWLGEYYRYLDNLALIDMSYVATWKERSRCENSFVFKLNDGPHPERIASREDFPPAARAFGALQRQQGRVNPHIPKNEREQYLTKNCDQILSGKVELGKSIGESQLVAGIILGVPVHTEAFWMDARGFQRATPHTPHHDHNHNHDCSRITLTSTVPR